MTGDHHVPIHERASEILQACESVRIGQRGPMAICE